MHQYHQPVGSAGGIDALYPNALLSIYFLLDVGCNSQRANIGKDNGLVPNRRQNNIFTET